MNERTFIELAPRGCGGTAVLREAHKGIFCPQCRRPCNHNAPAEMIVDDYALRPSPITAAAYDGVTFAKKSLLALIEIDDISRYLHVGAVQTFEGKLLEDWVYLYGVDRIIIRGTREAGFRTCPGCGRTLYSSQGPEYLYPAPDENVPIFQTDLCGILIDSRYLDRSRLPKARWLGSKIIKIADRPRDGLGEFPYPFG